LLRPILLTALLLAQSITALPLQASPATDAAAAIDAKLEAKDIDGALNAAHDLVTLVWEQSIGLGFSQSLLVAEPAIGFGIYNQRDNNIYKQGEPILIYCEPYGFGYGTPDPGLFSVNFVVDLQVLDGSGNQLANVPGATEFNLTTRHQNKEVQANITYSLDGIPVGQYTLVTTLRDKNSAKTGSFQTAIEIAK